MSYFISSLTPNFPDLHQENSAPLYVREGKSHLKVALSELKYNIKFFLLLILFNQYFILK